MGEALVDLVPEPVVGGAPLNVAVAAARLGTPTAFLGRTSSDPYGRQIRAALEDAGVDLRLVQTGSEPTLRAVVDHGPPVTYRFEGVDTADEFLDETSLALLGPGNHVLHACGLGLFRGVASTRYLDLATSHSGVVSVDPNPRPLAIDDRDAWRRRLDAWLQCSAIFRATEEDLDFIEPGTDPEEFMRRVVDGGCVVGVLGREDGTNVILTDRLSVDIPLFPTAVVDTVGAGDTFVGAFLSGVIAATGGDRAELGALDEDGWRRIGCFAAAAASITCSRAGARPPTHAEVQSVLD